MLFNALLAFMTISIISSRSISIKHGREASFTDCIDKQLPIQFDYKFFECMSERIIKENYAQIYNGVEQDNRHEKPFFSRQFENQTILNGQDARFTFSVKFDSHLQFILYQISGTQDQLALQPLHIIDRPFKALDSKKFKISRDKHVHDPNEDPQSEIETIHLTILNTNQKDSGYYLCIITNPTYVSRFTYGFLSVLDANDNTDSFLLDYKTFTLSLSIFLSMFILVVISVYCCKRRHLKDGINDNGKIIEKTLDTMKKNLVYTQMPDRQNEDLTVLLPPCDIFSHEFPRQNLVLGPLIDEGEFGRVFKAEAFHIKFGELKTQVAVKMLKENYSKQEYDNFIKELEIMKTVGKNDNIINLLGCCTTPGKPIMAIVEYAPNGNLRNYLREQRPDDYMSQTHTQAFKMNFYGTSGSTELRQQLLRWCIQISSGMKYLHTKNVCHRDLAARNVLLDEQKQAKIADFGLARDLFESDYYKRKSDAKVPVRWLAPECLLDLKFYPHSDVWSFGVLMWEIFSLGGNPYPSVPVENLFDYLRDGNRMSKPMYGDDEIYALMLDCWKFKADQRPSFGIIHERLVQIHNKHENVDSLTSSVLKLKTFTNKKFTLDSLKRESESDDSQYFSGTSDMSNSMLYGETCTHYSPSGHDSNESQYSAYTSSLIPSLMTKQFSTRPPSPPAPKSAKSLMGVATAAYFL